MKNKIGVYALGVWLLVMGGGAQAALVDTSVCMDPSGCGYYLPYEGRLAGFFNGDLNGTPILQMSINPDIYPPPNGTPVTLYSYDQVMAPTSGFTAEEQLMYAQMAFVLNEYNFNDAEATKCMSENSCGGYDKATNYAAANIAVWNLWEEGSIPFPSGGVIVTYDAAGYYEWAASLSGYDWSQTGIQLMIPQGGGDQFLVYTSTVPVPPAAWLFGSGLLGLVAVSRRGKSRA